MFYKINIYFIKNKKILNIFFSKCEQCESPCIECRDSKKDCTKCTGNTYLNIDG